MVITTVVPRGAILLGKIDHPELATQLYAMVYERISHGDPPSAFELHLWLDERDELQTAEERANCANAAADKALEQKLLAFAAKQALFDPADIAERHNMDVFLLLADVFCNIFDRLLAAM